MAQKNFDCFDLLLLELEKDIAFTEKIAPVLLQNKYLVMGNSQNPADYPITYIGWSQLNNPLLLKALDVPKEQVYSNYPPARLLKTYLETGGVLQGDSGGPVLMPLFGFYYQVAVVSAGGVVSGGTYDSTSTYLLHQDNLKFFLDNTKLILPEIKGLSELKNATQYTLNLKNTALDVYFEVKAFLHFSDDSSLEIPITNQGNEILELNINTDFLKTIPVKYRKDKAKIFFKFSYGGRYFNVVDFSLSLNIDASIPVVGPILPIVGETILHTIQENVQYASLQVIQKADGAIKIVNQNSGYSLSGGTGKTLYILKNEKGEKYEFTASTAFCALTDISLTGKTITLEKK